MITVRNSLSNIPGHFPLSCQWEITCRCNLRCVMCYTDCFNTPAKIREELPLSEILRIMDEIALAGCVELAITGGEPLARPDFFEIYEHAIRAGFLVTVLSNGTLINEAVADRLAANLPRLVEISFHGLTKSSFERITQGPGSFEKCLRGIRLLQERKIPLLLKTLAMTVNKNEVLEIKRMIEGLGGVGYKLGEDLCLSLDGSEAPLRFKLTDRELAEINAGDAALYGESCEHSRAPYTACQPERTTFHIDAYGMLQRCSGNRRGGYDLTQRSFEEGFYENLPTFPCPYRPANTEILA